MTPPLPPPAQRKRPTKTAPKERGDLLAHRFELNSLPCIEAGNHELRVCMDLNVRRSYERVTSFLRMKRKIFLCQKMHPLCLNTRL